MAGAIVSRPPTGVTAGLEAGGSPRVGVLVIVVNFRTPKLTIDCLHSLVDEVASVPGSRVVIVDNCSGDDSVSAIGEAIVRHGWSAWAKLVAHPVNGGFAAGNNAGLEAMPGPWKHVLLLNSDTIVHPGVLKACHEFMERDASVGAMSCRLLNRDGSVQNVARKFPTPTKLILCVLGLPWRAPWLFAWADPEDTRWDRDTACRDVGWIGGAFLWVRGDLMRRLGGLDERFFFYGEDIEFSHRVARAGFRRVYAPLADVTHFGGSSSDPTRMPSSAKSVNAWKGRYLVQRLCYGRMAERAVRGVDRGWLWLRAMGLKVAGRSSRSRELFEALRVLREVPR